MTTDKAETASAEAEAKPQPVNGAATATQAAIKVDTSSLKSSYSNVVSGNSTRDEVVLTFGLNQDWDLGPRPQEITLHHRIILSPGAAKRLIDLVTQLVRDHEARHGEIQ